MWFAFEQQSLKIFGSFGLPLGLSGVLGGPFRSLGGPWASFDNPLGSLVVPWVSLWGPWGPWGVLRRSQGVLGKEPKGTDKTEVYLGVSGGGLWGPVGDVGRLGWCLVPIRGGIC